MPRRQRLGDREQRRQARLVGGEQRPVRRGIAAEVQPRSGVADGLPRLRARGPGRRAPDVAVEEEVDVDLRRLRAVRADGEVAPVLLRAPAREAPAALGHHELLPAVAPAEREDLAGLLDAELGEGGRGEREARHPRGDRRAACHGGDPGQQRERTVEDRGRHVLGHPNKPGVRRPRPPHVATDADSCYCRVCWLTLCCTRPPMNVLPCPSPSSPTTPSRSCATSTWACSTPSSPAAGSRPWPGSPRRRSAARSSSRSPRSG